MPRFFLSVLAVTGVLLAGCDVPDSPLAPPDGPAGVDAPYSVAPTLAPAVDPSRVPCMSYRGTADPPQTDQEALYWGQDLTQDVIQGRYFALSGDLRGFMIVQDIASVERGVVTHLDQAVYVLDSETGLIVFGDGIHGRRPSPGSRVTAEYPRDRYVAQGPIQGENGEAGHIQLQGWLGEHGDVLDLTYHLVVCP